MSFEKTWVFLPNQTPADQSSSALRTKSQVFALKEFLKNSAGWTVTGSSTGTTTSASDLWTSPSVIGQANEGSAHGWVTLQSPEGMNAGADGTYTGDQSRVWLVLSLNNGNGNIVRISAHRVAPAGGTNTATPSSTTQILLDGQTINSLANGVMHFGAASSGHFYFLWAANGANLAQFALMIPPMAAVSTVVATSQAYPYETPVICAYNTSSPGALAQATFLPTSGGVQAWCADGTTTSKNCRGLALGNGAGAWLGATFPTGGDSVNNEQMFGALHVQVETVGKTAMIGRLADISASGAPTPQGSVDNVTTPSGAFFGNLWLPVNAVLSA
jgi:hypothetical protein